MKCRSRQLPVPLVAVILLVGGNLRMPQTTFAQQEPIYKLIAPELVSQGEVFTGMVVAETEKGEVPLSEGDKVVFQGVVVPVEEHGRIKFPPITAVGSAVLLAQITRASGAGPEPSRPFQVVVAPTNPNIPTKIAQSSPIVSGGAPFRVTGQGLGALENAALLGSNGKQINLGEPVGSSLQQIYVAPPDLAKGTYRFIAMDSTGHHYEAPNQSKCPTLKLEGQHISHRGQRGQITVYSDADGTLLLSGGEPQIVLDQRVIQVHANEPGHVNFTAHQVGDYKVDVSLVPPQEIPVQPGTPRLGVRLEPVQGLYNSSRNETTVTAPVHILDERGQPVSNVSVDVALAHPKGIEYSRVTTDSAGKTNFNLTLPGEVAASSLSDFPYHVPGWAWTPKRDGDPCCQVLGIEIEVGGTTEGSKETAEWLDKLKEKLQKAGGEGAETIGEEGSKIILGYKVITTLTRPWDIYATLGKGTCQGEKCEVKEKVKCRLIPRDKNGAKNGMPGGVGGSENEAWPPNVKSQKDWWDEVGRGALARALANIIKYCRCDDGSSVWPPPSATPVPGCK